MQYKRQRHRLITDIDSFEFIMTMPEKVKWTRPRGISGSSVDEQAAKMEGKMHAAVSVITPHNVSIEERLKEVEAKFNDGSFGEAGPEPRLDSIRIVGYRAPLETETLFSPTYALVDANLNWIERGDNEDESAWKKRYMDAMFGQPHDAVILVCAYHV